MASIPLPDIDAVILPGGFSFGDYLRCGAIAKFSPVMRAIKEFALEGGLVLGICNGFQVLVECGLLPGALVRNESQRFVCRDVGWKWLQPIVRSRIWPVGGKSCGCRLHMAKAAILRKSLCSTSLKREDRVALRYLENPNGSQRNIAGILNEGRNVLGMMPHPERAADPLVGGTDGLTLFTGLCVASQSAPFPPQ